MRKLGCWADRYFLYDAPLKRVPGKIELSSHIYTMDTCLCCCTHRECFLCSCEAVFCHDCFVYYMRSREAPQCMKCKRDISQAELSATFGGKCAMDIINGCKDVAVERYTYLIDISTDTFRTTQRDYWRQKKEVDVLEGEAAHLETTIAALTAQLDKIRAQHFVATKTLVLLSTRPQKNMDAFGDDVKLCPVCAVPIYKNGGCPDMWCVECGAKFRWDTLKLNRTLGEYDNPHYRENLARVSKDFDRGIFRVEDFNEVMALIDVPDVLEHVAIYSRAACVQAAELHSSRIVPDELYVACLEDNNASMSDIIWDAVQDCTRKRRAAYYIREYLSRMLVAFVKYSQCTSNPDKLRLIMKIIKIYLEDVAQLNETLSREGTDIVIEWHSPLDEEDEDDAAQLNEEIDIVLEWGNTPLDEEEEL